MWRSLFAILMVCIVMDSKAQTGPQFIEVQLSSDIIHPGDKLALSIYQLAEPSQTNLKIFISTELSTPVNTLVPIPVRKITNDLWMALSSSLNLTGTYGFSVKAYLEDPEIIEPLEYLIEVHHKRICKIEILLDTILDDEERAALEAEKADRLSEIAITKIQIAQSRELLQEVTGSFNVSGNLPPRIVGGPWGDTSPLLAQIENFSGNAVNVILCANLPVQDPEDGSDYIWHVNFGDGNEISFKNKALNRDSFENYGCVEHTYLENKRPTVTYTAIDKDGATASFTQTFDFRKNVQRPIPNLKVTRAEKVMTSDGNGNSIPGLKVQFNPFQSRTPSDSGIYLYKFYPYGRCSNPYLCPEFYNERVPLKNLEFTYRSSGNFYLQFFVKDNLQFAESSRAPVNINLQTFPENPTQDEINAAFGPAAIIRADRNNIKITDLNKGVEVKFDASSSFDLAGDDSKLTYYWDFGDTFSGENFSREKKPTHVYKNPGHYYVYMFVRDEHGNESIDDWMYIHVTHDSLQDAPLEFYAYKSKDDSRKVMFSIWQLIRLGASANEQFYWDYGDGTQDYSTGLSVINKTYEQNGEYTVKVTFQDITGKFVTLSKIIDTNSLESDPELANGLEFNPGEFSIVNETQVEVRATPVDSAQDIQYVWNFDEAKFFNGGIEESMKYLIFNAVGIKHVSLDLTNGSNFSSEYSRLYGVGNKEIKLSQFTLSEIENKTQVDFTISDPNAAGEISRIEVSNFKRGWSVIKNPTSLSHSVLIDGIDTVTIVVTDKQGNKQAFVRNVSARDSHHFPISSLFVKEIEQIKRYRKYLSEQTK